MKPGRLPEDDPLEQQARAKLRQLSPEAQTARQAEQEGSSRPKQQQAGLVPDPPRAEQAPSGTQRWT